MPEGDTIYRTARSLKPVLEHQAIVVAAMNDHTVAGEPLHRTVTEVEPRGKHLLIHFADGGAIHSHLGMTGSWHIYAAAEKWQKPVRQAALVLTTGTHQAVCFSPKTLEILSPTELRRHPWLPRLGPDILAEQLDLEEISRRLKLHGSSPIGVAIMNQTILCGIGNVYKSEVLFRIRVNPFLTVAVVGEEKCSDLVRAARKLMLRNLKGYPRTTRFGRDGQRQWVYGRNGQPCFECGAAIRMQRQGDLGRSTYFCPVCQADRA